MHASAEVRSRPAAWDTARSAPKHINHRTPTSTMHFMLIADSKPLGRPCTEGRVRDGRRQGEQSSETRKDKAGDGCLARNGDIYLRSRETEDLFYAELQAAGFSELSPRLRFRRPLKRYTSAMQSSICTSSPKIALAEVVCPPSRHPS